MQLNVSGSSDMINWRYELIDLSHGGQLVGSGVFTPNITFNAVRWSNKLLVFASDGGLVELKDKVSFFVNVPNSAPEILNLSTDFYTCESSYFGELFYVRDVDEDTLELRFNPTDSFYISPLLVTSTNSSTFVQLYSGLLQKDDVGYHEGTVSVNDLYNATCCVDTAEVNFTVLEINNAPVIDSIGVQTVNTKGEDSTFYKQVSFSDIEDGSNASSGNFTFNVSISGDPNLFNISDSGVINFTANNSNIGIYNVTVYVTDLGINNPHERINEVCNQTGGSITSEEEFTLTVAEQNSPPIITDYFPETLSFNTGGTTTRYFNITKYDPDYTIPDAYWYVGGALKEIDSGSSSDEFSYAFGCGVSGNYGVEAVITDGSLNDSITWDVNVVYVPCPPPVEPSGGGGGMPVSCIENWVCDFWGTCQNLDDSLVGGLFLGDEYRAAKNQCDNLFFEEENCGVQIRECRDLNNCNTTWKMSEIFQGCYFTRDPSCHDGLLNCHDGSCELLIDCGGPCSSCPTCSDQIRNQGESEADCGGPCPDPCPIALETPSYNWALILIALVLLTLIVLKLIGIFRVRQKLNSSNEAQL